MADRFCPIEAARETDVAQGAENLVILVGGLQKIRELVPFKLASSEVRDTLEVDEFFKSLASNSIAMPPCLWNPLGSPQQTWSISDKHDKRT